MLILYRKKLNGANKYEKSEYAPISVLCTFRLYCIFAGNLPCTFGVTYLARWGQPTLHIWCNLPCTLGATYLAHLVQPTLHAGGNLPCTFGATYLAHWGQPTLHIYRLSDKPNIAEYPAVSLTTARHFHRGSSHQLPGEKKRDILSCVLPPLHGKTDMCRPAASALSRPHTSPVR